MHRLLTLLLLLGVLTGMISGRYVHAAWVQESGECSVVHPKVSLCGEPHDHGSANSSQDDSAHAHGGPCHQHTCQHSIPPGISVVHTAFRSSSLLIGSVPTAPVPSFDEPVYELDTPPLI